MSEQVPYSLYLSSADQSQKTDQLTIEEFGIPGATLMEIAGTRAADYIRSHVTEGEKGLILCGKGNNAGDALVAARILLEAGYDAEICFAAGQDDLSTDTSKNSDLLRKLGIDISISDWKGEPADIYDYIIDGLLGTGVRSDLRAPYDEITKWVNEQNAEVFSMDIPTGIHPDTGQILGSAIEADHTLCFGLLKPGCYMDKGFDHSGNVVLCELPFPNKFKESSAFLIDGSWVNNLKPAVSERAHKYDHGVLYIIAGSEGLTGAATFAAQSAWATGLGAVVLITPKGLLPVYEKLMPEIIKKTVGDKDSYYFGSKHLDEVKSILNEKKGDLLIGPGLGRKEETVAMVQQLLMQRSGRVSIDADALFALSKMKDFQKPENADWLLTPHAGELKSMLNKQPDGSYERMIQSSKLAKNNSCYILSKGLPTILGTPDGENYITSYDTRVFSRAGFGDVLSGKCAAYSLMYSSLFLGSLTALLDGRDKAAEFMNISENPLEPSDLI